MSGCGTSVRVRSAMRARLPLSVRTGPACSATKTISASGRRPRVSYGPTASRAVKRSKRTMAICMGVLLGWVPSGRARGGSGGGTRPGPRRGSLTKARRMASGVP